MKSLIMAVGIGLGAMLSQSVVAFDNCYQCLVDFNECMFDVDTPQEVRQCSMERTQCQISRGCPVVKG